MLIWLHACLCGCMRACWVCACLSACMRGCVAIARGMCACKLGCMRVRLAACALCVWFCFNACRAAACARVGHFACAHVWLRARCVRACCPVARVRVLLCGQCVRLQCCLHACSAASVLGAFWLRARRSPACVCVGLRACLAACAVRACNHAGMRASVAACVMCVRLRSCWHARVYLLARCVRVRASI